MTRFNGTVMRRGGAGPVVAHVEIADGVMQVSSSEGPVRLNLQTLQLSLGGASGHMVFCVAPLDGVTVCVEHADFIATLRRSANGALDASCDALTKHKRTMHVWQWVAGGILLSIIVLLTQVPRLIMHSVGTLPVSVDRQIGDAAIGAINAGEVELRNPRVSAAIRTMLARMTPHAAVAGLDFRFHIIESEEVNAFALPGGQIVVFTGLLKKATRPEQVAGVLAHEISHATLRHGVRGLARAAGIRYGISLLIGDASGLLGYAESGAILAVIQSYSRDQERDADAEGVRMMIAAGIDPRGLGEFFQMMKGEPGSHTPGLVQWMSTHPRDDERIREVSRLARGAPARSAPPLDIDWPAVQASLRQPQASTANQAGPH
ncbi:MAG: M48 family metallopeptidase [Sandaracinaceae bacterium]|nr:M48 family metallopeptidase [Sandaracinaceae bacterium]